MKHNPFTNTIKRWVHHPALKITISILLLGSLLGVCFHALASGKDILSGTTADATTTIGSSGKKWLYLIEGISALFAYIKSKNVFVLGGVVVVAIFVNILLSLAGSTSP